MPKLKRHLNPATVISCIALFVALSGAAYAAGLGKKSVKTRHLGNGSVTTTKLRNGAVTKPKLRNFAVTAAKLRNKAVNAAKLRNGAVRSFALGGGVVTTNKLKNGGVSEEKLSADSVSTGKVQDGAVSAAKLNSGLLAQLVKNVSYETKESPTNSSSPKEATVECPDGKIAIGGGAKIFGGTTVALTDTGPLPPNGEGKRVGWDAAAFEIVADLENWHLEVYVVCAEL